MKTISKQQRDKTDVMSYSNDSMVSILLYNYEGSELGSCLESIFNHNYINNFEVVICDDHSLDGSWQIANHFAREYPGKVTLSRNNMSLGKRANRRKGLKLCKGKYCVELTSTAEFNPAYVRAAIDSLETDNFLEHSYISRLKRANTFIPSFNPVKVLSGHEIMRNPLVSVCIFNYNYGRYLRQCIESALHQTYEHIEICFSDNASTDDSWEIALEYAEKYPAKFSLIRNRMNFGPNVNLFNCDLNARGKYLLKLCSDDAIHPEFIERCVTALESNPEAAFAMVHRDIMDENGNCSPEPPFYDQSCLIPGPEQAAVYMMSSVNPCVSQILYVREKTESKRMAGNLNDRWFGDRIMDFHICCEYPIVYIKDPLLLNRVHGQSDGTSLDGNLMQCLGEYVLIHQLADIANNYVNMEAVQGRLQPGLEKLGRLCLRYCLRCLDRGDELAADRYFHLAVAFYPGIRDEENYIKLARYWSMPPAEREGLLRQLLKEANLVKRSVSYPPPPGSTPL